MNTDLVISILSILFGGGLGAFFNQVYTAKVNKRKMKFEADEASVSVEQKKQDLKQDAYDTVYQQLTKCLADYAAISEEYREHIEKTRKYEESVQQQIHEKCVELASLKSKVTYLQGLCCYDTLCPNRIKTNPMNTKEPENPDKI